MPYIEKQNRLSLDPTEKTHPAMLPGELNYQITRLIDGYLGRSPFSYSQLNAVVGVLECAKLELYRRIAVPYEDTKIKQNGDVYTCQNRTT